MNKKRTTTSDEHAPLAVSTLDFHGEPIYLVDQEGRGIVPMKPIVENLGLAWQSQQVKLKADVDLWGYNDIVIPSAGGPQVMGCIPLGNVHGWLLSIQASRVKADLRDKLRTYQRECFKVLSDYWSKGAAVHPALSADPAALAQAVAAALGAHPSWEQPLAEKLEQSRRCSKGTYETLKDKVLPALARLEAQGPAPAAPGAAGTARGAASARQTAQTLNAIARVAGNPQALAAAKRLFPEIFPPDSAVQPPLPGLVA